MSANMASQKSNPCECPTCHTVLNRKCDLPRHMRMHSTDKQQFTHKCPWPGCTFENLQRSNVNTHYRTHSQDKSKVCPDCEFRTCDPGSLTRHRKRIHGYVPKPRNSRKPKSSAVACADDNTGGPGATKAERRGGQRHHPYAREPTVDSSSSSSTSPAPCDPFYPLVVPPLSPPNEHKGLLTPEYSSIAIPPAQYPVMPHTLSESDDSSAYWDPETLQRLFYAPWPKPLYPATETTVALQNQNQVVAGRGSVPDYPSAKISSSSSLLLSGSTHVATADVYPEGPVDVQIGDFCTSTSTSESNLTLTSGWEGLNFSFEPNVMPTNDQQYQPWSLALPNLLPGAEQGVSFDSMSAVLPGLELEYPNICGQDFSFDFNQSYVAMGSPVWSSSSCSSPGSPSPDRSLQSPMFSFDGSLQLFN